MKSKRFQYLFTMSSRLRNSGRSSARSLISRSISQTSTRSVRDLLANTSSIYSTPSIRSISSRSWIMQTKSDCPSIKESTNEKASTYPSSGRSSSRRCHMYPVIFLPFYRIDLIFQYIAKNGKTLHLLKEGSKRIKSDKVRKKVEIKSTFEEFMISKNKRFPQSQ